MNRLEFISHAHNSMVRSPIKILPMRIMFPLPCQTCLTKATQRKFNKQTWDSHYDKRKVSSNHEAQVKEKSSRSRLLSRMCEYKCLVKGISLGSVTINLLNNRLSVFLKYMIVMVTNDNYPHVSSSPLPIHLKWHNFPMVHMVK